MTEPLGIGVVGCGYWGPNLIRSFARLPEARLVALCDADAGRLESMCRSYPSATGYAAFDAFLMHPGLDAVVLATSAPSHFALAERALSAGKPTFVEKPLTLSAADAARLVALAESRKLPLMVGHLLEYHPAVEYLKELATAGGLGDLRYLYSQRLNLGQVRREENALWSLAPHDLSMILDLVGARPATVAARGQAYLQPGVEDVVFVNLAFADGKMAQVQLSWLDPRKERRLTVVGSKKMVEFDDTHPTEKLRVYDKGYDRPPEFTRWGEYLTVRQGDIHIPQLKMTEPLEAECAHFLHCVRTGTRPRTDATHGLEVVRVLEAAQSSLRSGGQPVAI
jgi:predicted dehydrogenase